MSFQILDQKTYPLRVENVDPVLTFYPYEHRATIGWNTRTFMVFINHIGVGQGPTCHIEEIIGGHLEQIKDDGLIESLQEFSMRHGFLEVRPPLLRRII